MKMKRQKWSFENIQKEALKFQTRKQFQNESGSAYQAARKMGVIDEVCSHMQSRFRWAFELVQKESLKYKTRSEFGDLKCQTN